MSDAIKVLFTGGGGAGNEALWRLLGRRYILHFGDADFAAIDPNIPKDRRHELPWASDPGFIGKMVALCRRIGIDLLVPGVDEELLLLARNASALAPTRLLLPHANYVETMLDKLCMIRSLSEKKISVPRSQTLADDLDDICYPCISKPRHGRGSRNVRILSSRAEAMAMRVAAKNEAEETLLQEKIEGTEYTVQMVADDKGHLNAVVPVRISIKRGITIRAETEAEPEVISACRKIHEAVPSRGCYNIQLMLSPERHVLPFEINPRISTTLCLVVAAGIDPIAIFLENIPNKLILPFATGVHLRRYWTNYFSGGVEL